MSNFFKLIAHRGFSSHYPENTCMAFQKAIEYGVNMIETDIQLSKDGEWMVYHDDTLTRIHNDERWVNQVLQHDLTNKYSILTLERVLEIIDGKVAIYIDIKKHPSMIDLQHLIIILKNQTLIPQENIYLGASSCSVVRNLLIMKKGRCHKYKVGHIGNPVISQLDWWYGSLDFASLPRDLCREEDVKDIRDMHPNIEIFIYTLDDRISLEHFAKMDVDGLLSNNAKLLVEWFLEK